MALTASVEDDRIFTAPFVNLMVTNALLRICTMMLIALVPLYALDRGLSPAEAGLTTTFYMMAAVVVRPVSGRLVDERGRFAVMVLGATIYCAATGLLLLTLPVWVLFVARVVQGLGFSFNGTAVMTIATDIIPERRMTQGIGILGLEQTAAQLFAPWLALELRASYGYGIAFAVVFGVSVLNLLVRFPLGARVRRLDLERSEQSDERSSGSRPESGPPTPELAIWWHRIVERNAWRPAFVMFLLMVGTTGVNTFLAAYAISRGIENAGFFYTAAGVLLAASRLSVGPVQRRIGTTATISIGIGLVATSLAGIFWTPSLLVLVLAGACFGLGMGVVQPGLSSLAVLSAPRSARGLANSTFFMAMDLAQAIAAVLLGLAAGVAGLGSIFGLGAAVVAGSGATFLVMRARGLIR